MKYVCIKFLYENLYSHKYKKHVTQMIEIRKILEKQIRYLYMA